MAEKWEESGKGQFPVGGRGEGEEMFVLLLHFSRGLLAGFWWVDGGEKVN